MHLGLRYVVDKVAEIFGGVRTGKEEYGDFQTGTNKFGTRAVLGRPSPEGGWPSRLLGPRARTRRLSPHPPATRPFTRLRHLLTSGRGASLLRFSTAHDSLGATPGRAHGPRSLGLWLSCARAFPARLHGPLGYSLGLRLAPGSFSQTRHAALLPRRGVAPSDPAPQCPRRVPPPDLGTVCWLAPERPGAPGHWPGGSPSAKGRDTRQQRFP